MRSRENQHRITFALLSGLILTGIAYLPSFQAPFYLDDYRAIVNNLTLSEGTLMEIFAMSPGRFVTNLTFVINLRLGEDSLILFHIVNLLMHLVCGSLVWFIIKSLLSKFTTLPQNAIMGASLFLSGVFLLHPVNVQTVTYIAQRYAILASAFTLTAIASYLEFLRTGYKHYFVITLLVTLLGFMTKQNTVVVPFLLLFVDIAYNLDRGNQGKLTAVLKRILLIAPLIGVPFLLLKFELDSRDSSGISHPSGVSVSEYLITQVHVILEYLRLYFIPTGYTLDHDVEIRKNIFAFDTLMLILVHVFIVGLAFVRFSKDKLFAVGVFLFYLCLLPESSVIVLEPMFEHRLYLPQIGILIVIANQASRWFAKSENEARFRNLAVYCKLLVLVALACGTYYRNLIWADRDRMYQDMISKAPNKLRVYTNYAIYLEQANQIEKAFKVYGQAVEAMPMNPGSWMNLGLSLYKHGQTEAARAAYNKAHTLDPDSPILNFNLGVLESSMGNLKKAALHFEVCQKEPNLKDICEKAIADTLEAQLQDTPEKGLN